MTYNTLVFTESSPFCSHQPMAFFNLTALGPDNIFKPKQTYLYLFTAGDLKDSFDKISCGKDQINRDEVTKILSDLYRGPLPANDLEEWNKALGLESGSHFTLKQIIKALGDAQSKNSQESIKGNGDDENHFQSWTEYKDAASRHVRKPKGPKELLATRLISSQDYGWTTNSLEAFPRANFARKSCPETLYASHCCNSLI